jgi:hypothetical protein
MGKNSYLVFCLRKRSLKNKACDIFYLIVLTNVTCQIYVPEVIIMAISNSKNMPYQFSDDGNIYCQKSLTKITHQVVWLLTGNITQFLAQV